ncbi:hypothetical protein MRBLRH8O_001488 [Agrobacterium radiobacter]|uniref:hypothetical protein n=1 Tax=Agrobacterium radiobacter TaxID=362 RepID=UPI00346712A0
MMTASAETLKKTSITNWAFTFIRLSLVQKFIPETDTRRKNTIETAIASVLLDMPGSNTRAPQTMPTVMDNGKRSILPHSPVFVFLVTPDTVGVIVSKNHQPTPTPNRLSTINAPRLTKTPTAIAQTARPIFSPRPWRYCYAEQYRGIDQY